MMVICACFEDAAGQPSSPTIGYGAVGSGGIPGCSAKNPKNVTRYLQIHTIEVVKQRITVVREGESGVKKAFKPILPSILYNKNIARCTRYYKKEIKNISTLTDLIILQELL